VEKEERKKRGGRYRRYIYEESLPLMVSMRSDAPRVPVPRARARAWGDSSYACARTRETRAYASALQSVEGKEEGGKREGEREREW
jgi:hypothetical protein